MGALLASAAKIFLGPVGAISGLVASVALGIALVGAKIDDGVQKHNLAAAEVSINDPKTGYVARLAQATTNVAQLQSAIDAQNKSIADQSAADAARLAVVSKTVASAQAAATSAAKIAAFANHAPVGNDDCTRARDVDRAALELLR